MLQAVALFAKPPVPGRVKTRLARDIGDEAACSIYCRIADHTIQEIQASGIPLALCFDGQDPGLLPPTWRQAAATCLPQQGDTLGKRMAHALSSLFADGVGQAVLIGSDIPGMDAAYLQCAFELLGDHQLVIGPTFDGGYCLIGCSRGDFTPRLFEGIPWSTGRVLELTLQAAASAGLSTALLPVLRDVDTLEDLHCCNPLPPA